MTRQPDISRISRHRFNALTFSKSPIASLVAEEIEWYSDSQERVLATILTDRTDGDWNIIVLGRDEISLFRCIDVRTSFKKIEHARNSLFALIDEYANSGKPVFEQHDVKRKKSEIFELKVSESKVSRHFKILANHISHSSAREIIKEIAYAFVDLDGNFIEQFQTTGFNARLWELYLYAFFHESLFQIHEDHAYPDYKISKWGDPVFVECTTVSPNPGFDIKKEPVSEDQIRKLNRDYTPIKWGSSLFSKCKKRYWEKNMFRADRF